MAEAHEWTLRRLREMAGRLTEQAYLRASAAAGQDDEAHARWMLVFDRMARGLRLSIALEARLARERRWDAAEIGKEIGKEIGREIEAPAPVRADAPCEADRERDDDGVAETAPLAEQIGRLQAIIDGAGAPEPAPRLAHAERRALALQRAERARLAARELPPDEPWDVLSAPERAELAEAAPWRGSG